MTRRSRNLWKRVPDGALQRLGVAVRDVAMWLNPVAGTPSSALETAALLDSLAPSLMPRTSTLQGAAAGLTVLIARAVAAPAEGIVQRSRTAAVPLQGQLATRAALALVGAAAGALPPREHETLWRAGARSAGHLATAAAIGGAVYDTGEHLRARYPAQRAIRPLLVSTLSLAGIAVRASRQLVERESAVERWPVDQHTTLPGVVGTAALVTAAGSGLTRLYTASRVAWCGYFGPGPSRSLIARTVNAGLWAAAVASLYNGGVAFIGRANERVEPGYARPPVDPLLSGSPDSFLPFEDLGQQGRRFVTDVVTPTLIEHVLDEQPVAQPIRTYVGFNSEPIYRTGRAELALAELDRTGAFDRSYLLLVCPTGTGWIDDTMIEAAELFTRGDIATCCIQYGRYPSFLSLQKVASGRSQFRLLLWGIKQRLQERPPDQRPKLLVFGESLGAWASSDVVMYQGVAGFDHYGVDRALWVGLPGLAKWSRNGMARGASDLVPKGEVAVFDRHEQLAALDDADRKRLRAVILSHDDDPIGLLSPDLLIARPEWLGTARGRGVPDGMRWIPMVTFVQVLIDAANAMVTVPGQFKSFGHDYRADMARFVRDAFDLPGATPEQITRVEQTLQSLELERADRIVADSPDASDMRPPPAHRTSAAGIPLQQRRTRGARWRVGLLGHRRAHDQ